MFLRSYEGFSSDLLFVSSKWVSCVVFDPQNPNILASCSSDKTIKIWDITSGSCLSTLSVDGEVYSIDFAPCGNKFAVACNDLDNDTYSVKIFSKEGSTGNFVCQSTLTVDAGINGVLSVCFSPTDNVIAAGCSNGNIYLVDAQAGEVKSSLGHRCVPFPCAECLLL